jgi:hypothetical protein
MQTRIVNVTEVNSVQNSHFLQLYNINGMYIHSLEIQIRCYKSVKYIKQLSNLEL